MVEVGTFEAKTHLTQLLEKVAQGDRILITRRGKPVAMLVPPESPVKPDVAQLVREMLAARDAGGPTLGPGLTLRELIADGRRE